MRIGVVGTGFARKAHMPALRSIKDAKIVAVTSARLENARSAAAEFGIPHSYDDWRVMLATHDLDLVCVSTPVATHCAIVNAALSAGAHVLCDTPAAMDVHQVRSMMRHAQDADRRLLINHELRYDPNRLKIHRLINSGTIGKLRHIRIQNVTSGWNDPSGRSSRDWWSLADKGGGRLLANAPHQIDLIRWWGGEVNAVSGAFRRSLKIGTIDETERSGQRPQMIFASFLLNFRTVSPHPCLYFQSHAMTLEIMSRFLDRMEL